MDEILGFGTVPQNSPPHRENGPRVAKKQQLQSPPISRLHLQEQGFIVGACGGRGLADCFVGTVRSPESEQEERQASRIGGAQRTLRRPRTAQEYSPRRKRWVASGRKTSPSGAQEQRHRLNHPEICRHSVRSIGRTAFPRKPRRLEHLTNAGEAQDKYREKMNTEIRSGTSFLVGSPSGASSQRTCACELEA